MGQGAPLEINLATPALLFPALSLLMLAYTNRFLGLASLIRSLHQRLQESHDRALVGQIANLRRRLELIRRMQAVGVSSLAACVVCMGLLLSGQLGAAQLTFVLSLLLLLVSLGLSFAEILISTDALKIQLGALERDPIAGPPERP